MPLSSMPLRFGAVLDRCRSSSVPLKSVPFWIDAAQQERAKLTMPERTPYRNRPNGQRMVQDTPDRARRLVMAS
jgi:hypothetical protein